MLKIFRPVLESVYALPKRHIASECARQNTPLLSLVSSLLQQDLGCQPELCYHLASITRVFTRLHQDQDIL